MNNTNYELRKELLNNIFDCRPSTPSTEEGDFVLLNYYGKAIVDLMEQGILYLSDIPVLKVVLPTGMEGIVVFTESEKSKYRYYLIREEN